MPAIIYINKPPSVSQRPRCPGCNKHLLPHTFQIDDIQTNLDRMREGLPRRYSWNGEYRGYGAFCTLRCAARFANNVITITRKKEQTK